MPHTSSRSAPDPGEQALDAALEMSFPASDPVSVEIAFSRAKVFDAGEWFERHVRENPPQPVEIDDLVRKYQRSRAKAIRAGAPIPLDRNNFRQHPLFLMEVFVSCFQWQAKRARIKPTLAIRPDDVILEIIAEIFRRYMRGQRVSLDGAFGISARDRAAYRNMKAEKRADAIYQTLRGMGMLQKQALPRVAAALDCTVAKARKLLFAGRAVTKSKKS